MKAIKSVDVKSFVIYGAVLIAFWTFVLGTFYWLLGGSSAPLHGSST